MPPESDPPEVRDEGLAETLRHVEILGRLILRTLHRLEKTMADQNVTINDILAATKEQQGVTASMSTMLTAIHARVMQLVGNQVDPQTQAQLNEAFAEIKGNSRALSDAITTYTPDATAGQPAQTGTGGSTGGAPAKSATSTTLSTSKAVVNVGESVTFTAGVSSSDGNPNAITGSVVFNSDGGSIGSASVDSTGVASISLPVPAGDHSISATYGGDSNYASSTSSTITQSGMTPAPSTASGTTQAGAGQAGQDQTTQGTQTVAQGQGA